MGLDWNPLAKPKPGFEAEFEELFRRSPNGSDGLTKDELERFQTISSAPYELLGAPRLGLDPEADKWLLGRLVRSLAQDVLIGGRVDLLPQYVDAEHLAQHNPNLSDGLAAWRLALEATRNGAPRHSLPAPAPHPRRGLIRPPSAKAPSPASTLPSTTSTASANAKVVEHWDTIESVAPRSEWKNKNGKF